MPTTLRNTDILFNDGTTQSTAASAVPSSISAVGSILFAANGTTSNLVTGNTVAGSSLYYVSTVSSWHTFGPAVQGPNIFAGNTRYQWADPSALGYFVRGTPGNTGWSVPEGHTQLSGTWRVLCWCGARGSAYDSYNNDTVSVASYAMFQRIA